jgi:hypothetical protein
MALSRAVGRVFRCGPKGPLGCPAASCNVVAVLLSWLWPYSGRCGRCAAPLGVRQPPATWLQCSLSGCGRAPGGVGAVRLRRVHASLLQPGCSAPRGVVAPRAVYWMTNIPSGSQGVVNSSPVRCWASYFPPGRSKAYCGPCGFQPYGRWFRWPMCKWWWPWASLFGHVASWRVARCSSVARRSRPCA